MTRDANARLAGIAFLFYIAAGITNLALTRRAVTAQGAAALQQIAEHESVMRISAVLTLTTSFAAIVLAATMYAITREQDHDLALLAMSCRLVEGALGGAAVIASLGTLSLAMSRGAGTPAETAATDAMGAYLVKLESAGPVVIATFFAVGSMSYCWLLVRGRMIPPWMGWLGMTASTLLVVALPLQIGGIGRGMMASLVWLPMLVFELALAGWLLVRGAGPSIARSAEAL